MSQSNRIKPLSAALSAALLAGTATAALAAPNPFQMHDLSSGYQVAAAEGNCGASMKSKPAGEGNCGANMKSKQAAEGSCSANKDAKAKAMGDGSCGANKKSMGTDGSMGTKGDMGKQPAQASCGANKSS